jgi:hypothetical protein
VGLWLTASSLKSLICPALEISTSLNYLHFSFCRLFLIGLSSSYFYLHDLYGFDYPHPYTGYYWFLFLVRLLTFQEYLTFYPFDLFFFKISSSFFRIWWYRLVLHSGNTLIWICQFKLNCPYLLPKLIKIFGCIKLIPTWIFK